MTSEGLTAAQQKMTAGGVGAAAIDAFTHYYRQLEAGQTGMIAEDDIEALPKVTRYRDLEIDPEQAVAALQARACIGYAIAPEGTRKQVQQWKPGFWRIAHAAGVPVVVAAFDYSSRSIVIGPAFTLSDDMQADIARIQHWYAPFKGRNHDVVQPAD